MFCVNCGKELNESAKFCGNCGARVKTEVEAVVKTEPEAVQESGKKTRKKKKSKMIILGGIFIVLVIIAIVFCVLGILKRRNILDDSEVVTLYREKYYIDDELQSSFSEYGINENQKCVVVKKCSPSIGYSKRWYNYIYNSNIGLWEKLPTEEGSYNWNEKLDFEHVCVYEYEYVYEYDWLGRISERSVWNRVDNEKESHVKYEYQYNLKNQLTDVKIYDVETDEQLEWMKYHYDEENRCIKREWGYTEEGYQKVGEESRNSSWDITQAVSVYEWEYDDKGNVVAEVESKDFMNDPYGDTSMIVWNSDGTICYYDETTYGAHQITNFEYEGDVCIHGQIDYIAYDEVEDYYAGRPTEIRDLGYLVYECEPWFEYTYPSEEAIAKDIEENIDLSRLHGALLQCDSYSFSEANLRKTEGKRAFYYQTLLIEYPLFTRKFGYEAVYIYQDSKWELEDFTFCNEKYTLKDEVEGTWSKYLEASHPMHVDSYMTIDLRMRAPDGSSWAYDFYWTSRIPGGNDQSFSGIADMILVSPVYDENDCLEYLVIARDDIGKIAITNDGIVFLPVLSTNSYVLYKN